MCISVEDLEVLRGVSEILVQFELKTKNNKKKVWTCDFSATERSLANNNSLFMAHDNNLFM